MNKGLWSFLISMISQTKSCIAIESNVKAMCLVYHELLTVLKEFSIRRHFVTKHGGYGLNWSEIDGSNIITRLCECF